jgi:hypothetical protein
MAGLKKEKRGISVKKPFSFNGMEKINPAKNQILNELFAESRQQRSYGSNFRLFRGGMAAGPMLTDVGHKSIVHVLR